MDQGLPRSFGPEQEGQRSAFISDSESAPRSLTEHTFKVKGLSL